MSKESLQIDRLKLIAALESVGLFVADDGEVDGDGGNPFVDEIEKAFSLLIEPMLEQERALTQLAMAGQEMENSRRYMLIRTLDVEFPAKGGHFCRPESPEEVDQAIDELLADAAAKESK